MRKPVRLLSLIVMLLLVSLSYSPYAEAGCENQWESNTTYYAYVDVLNPNQYWCSQPLLSPPCPSCYRWQAIGQVVYSDCSGYSTWGDTTTCTGTANTQHSSSICGVICDP